MSIGLGATPPSHSKTPAEKLESTAFTFCKIATVCAIAGRYALPIAALAATGFYVAAFLKGKQDTRCILRFPLLIAGFWVFIAGLWIFANLKPGMSIFLPTWWR